MKHPWDRRLGVWYIAEDHPDHPAIVASPSGTTLTFGELAARAHQLVHGLRSRGVGTGDIVAYALPNDVDMLVWQLAAQESGLSSIALNPALSSAEVRAIVDHSGAKAIAIGPGATDRVDEMTGARSLQLRVAVGCAIDGFVAVDDLVADQPDTRPDDRVFGGPISYSSGTTGKPKAIWRPYPARDPAAVADESKLFGRAFQFLPMEGCHLVTAGMHHGGCQGFYQGALNVGQTLAIMGRFEAERTLAMIDAFGVTTSYMVPTQFVRLLRLPTDVRAKYDLSSLQVVVHSAAPCPLEVKKTMLEWWGPVIWETYGGMEGAATIAKPHRWLERPGTVGRAVRGMTVTILDKDGNPIPAGEVGHIYLQSRGPRFEYANDPALTASTYRGDAFTLGDMGYLDEDGYLYVSDRAKDLIISGGVNIYPADVEGVLANHPAVGDVAVIGVPDDEWGEQVKAVVELTDGVAASQELGDELIAFCREHLAGYKCPRSVDFTDRLPRTETGKLYKRNLRDAYWQGAERRV